MEKEAAQFILASASPRRRKMLEDAGYRFTVVVPDVDEDGPAAGDPHRIARANSIAKARRVAGGLDSGIVVAGDTVVEVDGRIIGKPSSMAGARRTLFKLSGTRHSVVSAVAIHDAATGRETVFSDETFVTMHRMTGEEINEYVSSGEALGKAGSYAIQETGDRFVEKLEGNLSTVVGFPLELFRTRFRDFLR